MRKTNKQEKYPGLEIGGKGNFFVLKKVQRNRWTLSQTWMNKTYGFYTFVYVSKKAEIRVEDQEAPCINWVHVRRVCVCTEKQWLEREKAETAAPGINIGTYRHTRHPKWAELQWRTNWRLIDVTWQCGHNNTRGKLSELCHSHHLSLAVLLHLLLVDF